VSDTPDEVSATLARVVRQERGRLVALLAGQFRDLDLADESVQDALEEAARTWPESGPPSNPAGWLLTVARRKAIDRLRRTVAARRRTLLAAPQLLADATAEPPTSGQTTAWETTVDHARVADDRLRLILLCCHPALDPDTQVALTLRLVGGLTTAEIAAAYLLPEPTLAQRIVRAKRKIREARIPLTIPAALDDRVGTVLRVIYLIFNEGYLTRRDVESVVRVDLVDEAVRLTGLLVDLVPAAAEAKGLLALELFHRARMRTRLDGAGELVLLADQDRSRWGLTEIRLANRVLRDGLQQRDPGPFVLQAVIAAQHANARTAADTDWPAIVTAYNQLLRLTPSPVVALNRAVAVAEADGPGLGLALLCEITGLEDYHLWRATQGELLLRTGDRDRAAHAFGQARELTANPAEQRHLDRRLRQIKGG